MTIWTDFVKNYAVKNKVHYMVATTDPKCREAYKKSREGVEKVEKVKVPKIPKEPKVSKEPKETKKPKESKEPKEPKESKKKLTEQLKGKLVTDL